MNRMDEATKSMLTPEWRKRVEEREARRERWLVAWGLIIKTRAYPETNSHGMVLPRRLDGNRNAGDGRMIVYRREQQVAPWRLGGFDFAPSPRTITRDDVPHESDWRTIVREADGGELEVIEVIDSRPAAAKAK